MDKATREYIQGLIIKCEKWVVERKKITKNWSQYQDKCKETQEGRDKFYKEYGEAKMYHSTLKRLRDILVYEDASNLEQKSEYIKCWNCNNPHRLEGHQYCFRCGVTFSDSEEGCGNNVTEKERNLLGYIHDALTNTYDDKDFSMSRECSLVHSLHYHLWRNRKKFSEDEQKLIKNIENTMDKVWGATTEKVKNEKDQN